MTIPNLPTDNLYKFIALSGVFIYLACMVAPHLVFDKLQAEAQNIETEIGVITYEIGYLKLKDSTLSAKIDEVSELLDMYDLGEKTDSVINIDTILEKIKKPEVRNYLIFKFEYFDDLFPVVAKHKEVLKLQSEIDIIRKDITINGYKALRKQDILDEKYQYLNTLKWLWWMALIGSLIMIFLGFYLWYTKVQIHLDKKLKKDYEN